MKQLEERIPWGRIEVSCPSISLRDWFQI